MRRIALHALGTGQRATFAMSHPVHAPDAFYGVLTRLCMYGSRVSAISCQALFGFVVAEKGPLALDLVAGVRDVQR
jgi:hypothetical protein